MKVLVEKYIKYGERGDETLEESFVMEDTKENREKIIKHISEEKGYIKRVYKENFINGKIRNCSYDIFDGGCSQTGGSIYIKTYDQKIKEIDEEFRNKLLELGRLFI